MRQEAEFFGEAEMDLLFIAKKLKESLPLEEALTALGIDFAIELDVYRGGIIFPSDRTGVFFYVLPEKLEAARTVTRGLGFKPHQWED